VIVLAVLEQYLEDDRILIDIETEVVMKMFRIGPAEVELSHAMQECLRDMASQPGGVSRDEMYERLNAVAESHGCEYGIPIPAGGEMETNHLVMAHGVPLGHIIAGNQYLRQQEQQRQRLQATPREAAQELIASGLVVRNSWSIVGDRTISVIDTPEGPMCWPSYHAVARFSKMMRTACMRMESHLSAEAELKAMESLKAKVNPAQWRCYVLNGCFFERSERSDIHYIFRKGLPTIAMSYHGYPEGRALAALCLHPMGFFQYTHAGLMTPTDEVICHLLLMRADERKFWAKSGQWSVTDTRSGI
jgi:hypothetical protein